MLLFQTWCPTEKAKIFYFFYRAAFCYNTIMPHIFRQKGRKNAAFGLRPSNEIKLNTASWHAIMASRWELTWWRCWWCASDSTFIGHLHSFHLFYRQFQLYQRQLNESNANQRKEREREKKTTYLGLRVTNVYGIKFAGAKKERCTITLTQILECFRFSVHESLEWRDCERNAQWNVAASVRTSV